MATTTAKTTDAEIMEIQRGRITVCIKGRTPIILAAMSQKAKQTILFPPPRKNTAERASSLKHQPLEEYRASPYRMPEGSPTELALVSSSFKQSMLSAALDMPGATKSQIGRLVYVESDYVPLYGIPQLFMSIVRSADINRTPDVRTRAIVPHWATVIEITFAQPLIKEQQVLNLLSAAGMMAGVGDWRPQKGKGNYGQFEIVPFEDSEFQAILKAGTREPQVAALSEPRCYDHETEELLTWFDAEIKRRGFSVVGKEQPA